jgi:tetratricopeptide (TPR) repeat protein
MRGTDQRTNGMSGATPAAMAAYEQAVFAFQNWRLGADDHVAAALREAPDFVMAHALQAYMLVCTRDPEQVRAARPVVERLGNLPASDRERLHLSAIAAAVGDDYERAKGHLGRILDLDPRDALALHVAHSFDHLTGDIEYLNERVAAVLPAWSSDLAGYSAVLAMHAFGLEEAGDFQRAEQTALAALALDGENARAHHVMAHVFEMTDRPEAGVRWLTEHRNRWQTDTVVATHCWWHLALFHLSLGDSDRALALYDRRIRVSSSSGIADLIDASALLWRVQLHGGDPGHRWMELASAWAPHIDDGFCSFNDVHAMLAFVGGRQWRLARRLENALAGMQLSSTRHGQTTRQLGLPACSALLAFGQGNNDLAIELFEQLPPRAYQLGGSHAQRDVLYLTLQSAYRASAFLRPRQLLPRIEAQSAHIH